MIVRVSAVLRYSDAARWRVLYVPQMCVSGQRCSRRVRECGCQPDRLSHAMRQRYITTDARVCGFALQKREAPFAARGCRRFTTTAAKIPPVRPAADAIAARREKREEKRLSPRLRGAPARIYDARSGGAAQQRQAMPQCTVLRSTRENSG